MADKKISALTGASTPLAGTEVLPIVQSNTTKKVSVADLTSGRAISATAITATDNFVVGTAGKGIDFSANTSAAGMTSELLNDYEEGTWTPTVTSAAGTVTLVDGSGCTYTKVGRMVYVFARIGITTDASVGTSDLTIGGLPYSVYQYSFANLSSTNYSALDFGTGGAHGLVLVTSTSMLHVARTVDISSRSPAFYWSYASVYSV